MTMSDKVYDVLKWVGLIMLPALATAVGTIGTVCEWAYTTVAVTVITAVGTFIGACVGASNAQYVASAASSEAAGYVPEGDGEPDGAE